VRTIAYIAEEEEETSSGKSTTDSSRQAGMTKKRSTGLAAQWQQPESQKARKLAAASMSRYQTPWLSFLAPSIDSN
jgi:hypothetical protein